MGSGRGHRGHAHALSTTDEVDMLYRHLMEIHAIGAT
jgi:hypothetical protein